MYSLITISALLFVCYFSSVSAQDFIICKLKDYECQVRSGRAYLPTFVEGIPSLGLPALDPIYMDKIENANSGLKIQFTDVEVTGFKNTLLDDLKIDFENLSFNATLIAKAVMSGKYMLNGKLLVLPVEGNGKFTIDIREIRIGLNAQLAKKVEKSNGKEILQIVKFTPKSDPQDINYKFENLFNGNEELSQVVHDFANNNFREVMFEVGGPILDTIVKRIVKQINKFLRKYPTEELFVK